MQLWCIVRKRRVFKRLWFQRIFAGLLFIAFLSIPLTQAFHHHSVSLFKSEGKANLSANFKCNTCDYLAHHEGKQFYSHFNSAFVVLRPDPVAIIIDFNCKIFQSSLPCFTNKGPPSNS